MEDWDKKYNDLKKDKKISEAPTKKNEKDHLDGSKPCYTYKETGGCVMGMNLKKIRNVTFEQCQTACDKNKRCKGIEYYKKSFARMTSRAYREGDCLLNSGTNTKSPPCDADLY